MSKRDLQRDSFQNSRDSVGIWANSSGAISMLENWRTKGKIGSQNMEANIVRQNIGHTGDWICVTADYIGLEEVKRINTLTLLFSLPIPSLAGAPHWPNPIEGTGRGACWWPFQRSPPMGREKRREGTCRDKGILSERYNGALKHMKNLWPQQDQNGKKKHNFKYFSNL